MDGFPGRPIKGYELLERIGGGGHGAVYRAKQSTVGREVAVRIVLPLGFFHRGCDFIWIELDGCATFGYIYAGIRLLIGSKLGI